MTGTAPLVTVGLPVYNGARTIGGAIGAIKRQSYRNLEILIADNCSTDATEAICHEYALGDERIRYVRHERNRGAVWNFNYVLQAAAGELFMWAAHDDVLHAEFVSRTQAVLADRPEVVLCHSEAQPVLDSGEPAGPAYVGWTIEADGVRERWRVALRRSELHAAIYGLMRRDVAWRTRGLLPCVQADWIFIIEMAVLGTIGQVPETLQYKRVPAVASDYHTREEMLRYMGARSAGWRAQLRPPRANVMREAVRALTSLGVPRRTRASLSADAMRIYAGEGGWRVDLNDVAATALALRAPRSGRSDA